MIFSLALVLLVTATASAQTQPAASSSAYQTRCASCHGAAMTGGSAASILTYIRYHTDAEVTASIRDRHRDVAVTAIQGQELSAVLSAMRALAGTNPAMATGGFTGSRGRGAGRRAEAAREGPAQLLPHLTLPPHPREAGLSRRKHRGQTGSLQRRSRWPTAAREQGFCSHPPETSAVLLDNGRFTLLSKDGAAYREKAITPKADWTHYDGSLTGNRYSPLELINPTNVQRLGAAWVFPIASNPRALQDTRRAGRHHVRHGGTRSTRSMPPPAVSLDVSGRASRRHPQRGGIGTNRGVTISGDKAFMVTDHAHLLAFNRFTGQKLWDAEMGSYEESYSSTSPPLPVGDLLVVGVAGGEEGARGFLDAYRASTGERIWRWYSIPKRGEKGSETWIGQALEHGCGATWMPGSYDPQLDLIYWAIGNPCPDIAGEERIGDNLYTSSVVALTCEDRRDEVVLPVHAARHARLGRRAADAARRRSVAGQAAQAV